MNIDLHRSGGAFALDALPEDERLAFEAHLAECGDCRAEVRELQATTAALAAGCAMPPPPALRGRVLAAVAQTRQESPQVTKLAARRRPLVRGRFALAAAAASVVVAAATSVLAVREDRRADELAAQYAQVTRVLTANDAAVDSARLRGGGTGTVVVSAALDTAVFVGSGLPAVSSDRTYQLWVIDASGPRSAGVFRPDEAGRATLATTRLGDANAIAVTLEPAGGSDQPTTEPLVAVKV